MIGYVKSIGVWLFGLLGLTLGVFIGEWCAALTAFLILNCIDLVTGIIKGLYLENLSSREMFKGLLRKLAMWCGVALAHQIDVLLFNGSNSTQMGLVFGFIATEGLSITENLVQAEVIVNEDIIKYLRQIKSTEHAKDEDMRENGQ